MHIAIDARVINSGTGTYIVKLLEYLQQIDNENSYSVLVRAKDKHYWQQKLELPMYPLSLVDWTMSPLMV